MPPDLWLRIGCIATLVVLVAVAGLGKSASSADDAFTQVDVFVSGTEGYHTYRIPGIVLSNEGTLLAFCEGRKTGRSDHGDLDLVLRRSSDGGKTWEPMQLVYEEGGTAKVTIGNPCPVVDRTSGTIWLPFCLEAETRTGMHLQHVIR